MQAGPRVPEGSLATSGFRGEHLGDCISGTPKLRRCTPHYTQFYAGATVYGASMSCFTLITKRSFAPSITYPSDPPTPCASFASSFNWLASSTSLFPPFGCLLLTIPLLTPLPASPSLACFPSPQIYSSSPLRGTSALVVRALPPPAQSRRFLYLARARIKHTINLPRWPKVLPHIHSSELSLQPRWVSPPRIPRGNHGMGCHPCRPSSTPNHQTVHWARQVHAY